MRVIFWIALILVLPRLPKHDGMNFIEALLLAIGFVWALVCDYEALRFAYYFNRKVWRETGGKNEPPTPKAKRAWRK